MNKFNPANILDKIARYLPRNSVEFFSGIKTLHQIEGKNFQAPLMENNFNNITKLVHKFSELKNRTSGMLAIDIGANVGLYSSALLMAGFKHIHTFEPNAEIQETLLLNLSNFEDSRYTIHNYGITQITQKLKLSAPVYATTNKDKKFDLYNSGTKSIFGSGQNFVECDFFAYDDIDALKQLKHCDLIKIDVEGAELEVIKAILPLIEKYKPLVFMELNPNYRDVNFDIFDVLKSLGYRFLERVSDNKIFDINAHQDFHDGKDYIFSVS